MENLIILNCCLIMHNIIAESRRHTYSVSRYYRPDRVGVFNHDDVGNQEVKSLFGYDEYIGRPNYDFGIATAHLQYTYTDPIQHRSLKDDLIHHQWDRHQIYQQR